MSSRLAHQHLQQHVLAACLPHCLYLLQACNLQLGNMQCRNRCMNQSVTLLCYTQVTSRKARRAGAVSSVLIHMQLL